MAGDSFVDRLADTDREALLALGRRRSLARGQVLFFEGDEGRDVLVLLEGQVKASACAASGREIILDVLDAGELLGELSAIDQGPRSATVTALTPVVALVVPIEAFITYLASHPAAATETVRMIAARLRNASQRQLEFGTSDALARLCVCLLDMLRRYGSESEGAPRVTVPLAQHDIAAMTGLSREAVVKGLRALRALGWIDTHGRDVVILDQSALRARAEG